MKDQNKMNDSHEHYVRVNLSRNTKLVIVISIILIMIYIVLPIILNTVYGNFFPLIRWVTLIFALAGPSLFIIFLIVIIINAIQKIRNK